MNFDSKIVQEKKIHLSHLDALKATKLVCCRKIWLEKRNIFFWSKKKQTSQRNKINTEQFT